MNDVLNRGDEVEFIGFDSLESMDENLKYKLETGRWYTVRANVGKNGILLEEIVNSPANNNDGEIGFPKSSFRIIQEKEKTHQAALLTEARRRFGMSWKHELISSSAIIALGFGLLAGTNFWLSIILGVIIGSATIISTRLDVLKKYFRLLAFGGALSFYYFKQGVNVDFSDFWTGAISLMVLVFTGFMLLLASGAVSFWISFIIGKSDIIDSNNSRNTEETSSIDIIFDTVLVFLIFELVRGFGIVDQLYKVL